LATSSEQIERSRKWLKRMSPDGPTAQQVKSEQPAKSGERVERMEAYVHRLESVLVRRLLIVGVLGVMVMIGLFLSNYSIDTARYYWSAMFPIFGLACIAHELASGRAHVIPLWRILLRQVLHWMGPIVAVKILFLQHARGQMSLDAVALAIILVLAVTCFLAGIHFDHSFYWISAFLILAAVVGTEIETYLWIVAVLILVGIAIAVLSAVLMRGHSAETTS
jgi:hypothetical protein